MIKPVLKSVVVAAAWALTACGDAKPLERNLETRRQAQITFSGLDAAPDPAPEGTAVSITATAAATADDPIRRAVVFFGEIDPATGLEASRVLCDDDAATSAPDCNDLTVNCNATHTYRESLDSNGSVAEDHTARCEITSASGTTTATINITIDEVAHTVDARSGGANSYSTTEDVAFTPSATFADASMNGAVLYEDYECQWNWGDGASCNTDAECGAQFCRGNVCVDVVDACTPSTVNIPHTYPTPGTYTATLTVINIDSDALAPVSSTAQVTVVDTQPTIDPIASTPNPSAEGEPVTFTARVTAAPEETVASCTWDWGDGTTTELDDECIGATDVTITATHVYADGDPTDYVVTLRVDDADSFVTRTAVHGVNNVAPVVAAPTSSSSLVEGQSIVFDSSFTDAADADWLVEWDVDHDGATFAGDSFEVLAEAKPVSTSRAYDEQGTYQVAVRVTDQTSAGTPNADSLAAQSTATFIVADASPSIVDLTSNSPQNEGSSITFTVTLSATSADPIQSCVWDPGNGDAPETFAAGTAQCDVSGGVSSYSHVYPQSGNFTATVTVNDEDNNSFATTDVQVVNVAPTVALDTPPNVVSTDEGTEVVFVGSFTDPAGTADGAYTCTFSYGDGTTEEAASGCEPGGQVTSRPHTYDDDSADACGAATCAVRLTVVDKDGAGSSDGYQLPVVNVAPALTVHPVAAVEEGTAASVRIEATDAGSADGAELRYDYDWGNDGICAPADGDLCGTTQTAVTHLYPDAGSHTVRITARDDDGGVTTQTAVVTVTDKAPSIVSFFSTAPKAEGEVVTAVVQPNLAEGDTYSYSYDFGDGSAPVTSCGTTCTHAYADNGSYQIQVTLSDDEGGSASQTVSATITNVAPTPVAATGTCGTASNGAGGSYVCDLNATDPGADTAAFRLTFAPAGMAIDAATGVVSWTPSAAQVRGPHSYQVEVSDEDGGAAYFSQTVSSYLDTDNDGLPDAWEDAYGTDKAQDDAASDADGDGRDNLEEFQNGTDPNSYDGPGRPVALSPANGDEVATDVPTLRVQNAASEGATTYTFEVFADAALTSLVVTADVAEGTGQLEGGVSYTEWQVSPALGDNAHYWWRARANDGQTTGANSAVARFFVNTANDAPSAPVASSPAENAHVPSRYPALEVGNAPDIDGDAKDYHFEIAADAAFSQLVASGIAAEGNGTTRWTSPTQLSDNTRYLWRARAVDEHGTSGPYSDTRELFVNTSNNAPTNVTLLSPTNEAEVAGAVALTLTNATDVDGDALAYEFEIDSSEAFDRPVRSGRVDEGASGQTSYSPSSLADNTRYFWRARATDGASHGDWTSASFFRNTANDAPGIPAVQNPMSGSVVDRNKVVLVVRNTTDADRDGVTYAFTIYRDAALTDVHEASAQVAAGAAGETRFVPTQPLDAGRTYYWTARATDDAGLAGAVTEAQVFHTIGNAGSGGGAGCAQAGGALSPLAALLLAAAALRRRRSQERA